MTFDPALLIDLLRQEAQAARLWQPQRRAAGERLFDQGEAATHGWVLTSGLLKLSYVTADGQDWIKSFVADCGLFAGTTDFGSGGTNHYGALCLEDCNVAALPSDWLTQRIADNAALQAAMVGFSLWLQQRKQKREQSLLCLTAEQRYRAFLAESPSLAGRLRQNDIARYIGVTAVALSRIRKRVAAP